MTAEVASLPLATLRKKHPRFVYQSFDWKHEDETLTVSFQFLLEPDILFRPVVTLGPLSNEKISAFPNTFLNRWVFHLGLIELLSYWKLAASPEIVIEAGFLSPGQLKWWHNLLLSSMGEYFYTNDIDFTQPDFVQWTLGPKVKKPRPLGSDRPTKPSQTAPVLIPVGGGKDSALLLEMLEKAHQPFDILLSFPQSPAAETIAQSSHAGRIFTIHRVFDPQLFTLNAKGYLNGHTPFSARLAFESSFLASLAGHSQVLLANEFSANEGNVPFRGTVVNHQYSKTFEFEQKFRKYVAEYLSPAPSYFSALRPLTELQIAGIFSQFPRFHTVFKSCNRGQKTNTWCCQCAKCLFVFTVLFPFLEEKQLIGPIFPENLFENQALKDMAQALMGKDANKPFECVGTYEETQAAFFLSIQKFRQTHPDRPLPPVLQSVWEKDVQHNLSIAETATNLLCFWNTTHNLNPSLAHLVQAHAKTLCQAPTVRPRGNWQHTESLQKLENARIVILGIGREGWQTYRFLRRQFPQKLLILADQREEETLPDSQQEIVAKDPYLGVFWGEQYTQALDNAQIIFKTPGIPKTLPALKKALSRGALLHSHTQLFFELCQSQIIGVTGTKGKSTTSAVIHHVLKENGIESVLVGNIGQPALELLPRISASTVVVFELSSHQLETMTVSPHIAVVQDVTSEHLDYYADTTAYRQAKTAIARFQKASDFIIFNPEFSGAREIARLSPAKHLHFTLTEGPDAVVFVRNGVIFYKQSEEKRESVLPVSEIPLQGEHNILNVMPAVAIGGMLNLSVSQIATALKSFRALPHRLEFVLERKGIRYYDDSLSTLPEAAVGALKSFSAETTLVLIAGGYERHQDFTPLAEQVFAQNITGLVLFRPTGERLAEEVKKQYERFGKTEVPTMEFADSMLEAVHKAQHILGKRNKKSGVVLMSPASASFGMFKDYQDRGEQFIQAVQRLA